MFDRFLLTACLLMAAANVCFAESAGISQAEAQKTGDEYFSSAQTGKVEVTDAGGQWRAEGFFKGTNQTQGAIYIDKRSGKITGTWKQKLQKAFAPPQDMPVVAKTKSKPVKKEIEKPKTAGSELAKIKPKEKSKPKIALPKLLPQNSPKPSKEKAGKRLIEARALINKREHQKAMEKYNEAIELNPADENAYVERARLHEIMDRDDEALADLNSAVEINPKSVLALNERGVLHRKNKNLDQASADFKKSIEADPKFVYGHLNLAEIEIERKNTAAAAEHLTQAINLGGQEREAYWMRANIYFESKDFDRAIPDYEKALAADPQLLEARFNLAVSLYKKKRYAEAQAHFDQALKVAPKWALFHCWRGLNLYALENYDAALAAYKATPDNDEQGLCRQTFTSHYPAKKATDTADAHSRIIKLLKGEV